MAAAVSDLWSTRIKGISAKEPEKAMKMLDDNKQFILGQDVDKVDKLVTDRLQTQIGARAAHALNSGFMPYMRPEWILRFNGVDERLQQIFQVAQKKAYAEGLRFTITDKGGLRDAATQRMLFRAGFSKTLDSNHMHGLAMDVAPLDENGKINWNDRKAFDRIDQLMFESAQELGYQFSGEHNKIKNWDPGHYSLPRDGQSQPVTKYQPMTEQEKVRLGQQYYNSIRPGDDVGLVKVENAIIGQHNKFQAMQRDQNNQDKNAVISAMAVDPENQPYTEQDLLARDGQVEGLRQAWDRLADTDPAWRLKVVNTMRSARIKHDDEQEYTRLTGMAKGLDGDPARFLDEDIWNNPKLTFNSKKHFRALQEQVEKGEGNPAVQRAYKWMAGANLVPDEIRHPTPGSKAAKLRQDVFGGNLHEAMEAWSQTHNGKQPTQKDVIDEIGPDVARQSVVEKGWIYGQSLVPIYKHKIPTAEQEKIKQKWAAEHDGDEPSEKQIYNAFARAQFDALYAQRKAKAGKPGGIGAQ